MRKLRAFWLRFCAMFAARRIGDEFDTELEGHLAEQIDEGVRSGLSEAEARRQACCALGAWSRCARPIASAPRYLGLKTFCGMFAMRYAGFGAIRFSPLPRF